MHSDEVLEELDRILETRDTVLHLNYCSLSELPRDVLDDEAYRHIHRIYIKQNVIQRLPEDIGLLHNLVELYLHSNDLIELTEGICQLENLQSLDASNNCLTYLPRSIGNLHSLERLVLSHNAIRELPPEIGCLQNLTVMEIMNNRLQSLPSAISQCQRLTRLLLDRNQIKWLPVQMSSMKCLEELSVAANQLLGIPLDLGEVASLRSVYVDNNKYLHALPVGLNAQEIGFNSCGSHNFDLPQGCNNNSFVLIDHEENQSKHIWLSPHLKRIGNLESPFVASLKELCMQQVKMHRMEEVTEDGLPSAVYNTLMNPTCVCHCCRRPLFTEVYPMVFEGQIRLYCLYRVALCCSLKCVRLASLIVQLPLIYPSSSNLHMAVALID